MARNVYILVKYVHGLDSKYFDYLLFCS